MDKLEIIGCYEAVVQEAQIKGKRFNKKEYESNFENLSNLISDAINEMFSLYHESGDDKEVLKEYASVFAGKVIKETKDLSKRQKSCVLLDYNLGMVTYVFPVIMNLKDSAAEEFTDFIVEDWNGSFENCNIAKSTKQGIVEGFKSGWCYITTAVCESQNMPDDCYELNLLRDYRDQYLLNETVDGEEIVKEYYNVAPTIVKRINKRSDSKAVYESIYSQHIKQCIALIEKDSKEECKEVYSNMVESLKKEYFN